MTDRIVRRVLCLALALALLVPAFVVHADTVVNNVNVLVDTVKTVTIDAGDAGMVGYALLVTNGTPAGDQTGCNAQDSSPVRVYLNVPDEVSVGFPLDLDHLAFDVCSDGLATATYQDVTFTSEVPGIYSVSVLKVEGGKVDTSTKKYLYEFGEADFQLVVLGSTYDWDGFFRPVENLPTLNQVKAGSAIPIKFSLSGDQGLGIMADGYPSSVVISCEASTTAGAIEETVTAGGSSLSYDAVADQYVYVWKTDKGWANSCRQLEVKLIDGTSHYALFSFKK